MNLEPVEMREFEDRLMGRPFWRAFRWACVVWLVAMGLGWLLSQTGMGERWLADVRPGDAIFVAIASLLIAFAAMIPAWSIRRIRGEAGSSQTPQASAGVDRPANRGQSAVLARAQTTRLVASVLIRLFGTVALFLACRYQLATPIEKLAAMVLGWYVLLTFVEILMLARGLSSSSGTAIRTANCRGSEMPATAEL